MTAVGSVTPAGEARATREPASSDAKRLLRVSHLAKAYGERKAVDGVSFDIRRGECFGLLGPNGAGKTTTILAICGLVRADAGEVLIGDGLESPARAENRKQLGYVPQELALYEDLTGRENLRFFGRLYGLKSRALDDRIEATLDFVDLSSRGGDKVSAYSGGMKRRLNIAAALLHEPTLLILDEPTVGIDPQSRNAILENLAELRSQGVALLYTSHYMEEVERICDRIAIMDEGRILAEGTSDSLLTTLGDSADRVRLTTGRKPSTELVGKLGRLRGVVSATATPDGPELAVRDIARVLPTIMALVSNDGCQITGMAIEQPDLETVFLHLTGKALRDA